MKPLSEWPLDGLITFAAVVLSLLILLVTLFIEEKDKNTLINGKYQLLTPKIHKIYWGMSVVMAVIVSYVVSQAGNCPTMTVAENIQNKQIGLALATAFWAMVGLLYHQTFLFKKEFDLMTYECFSPLFHRTYFWKDFKGVEYARSGQFLVFDDHGKNKKTYMPWKKIGILGLSAYINSRLMSFDNPVSPTFDEKLIEQINNKRIYVLFFELDEDLKDQKQDSFFGNVTSISSESILIKKDNGDIFKAPPNLRGFIPMEMFQDKEDCPWNIDIAEDTPVDWIAVYYVTKGKEHVH